jgi:hypothetical protein
LLHTVMLRFAASLAVAVLLPRRSSAALPPPPLSLLTSAWQPCDVAHGATAQSAGWGSFLLSTSNVLGVNALTLPPFSSGWAPGAASTGWPVDTASLFVGGAAVAPPPPGILGGLLASLRGGGAGGAAAARRAVVPHRHCAACGR